MQYRNPCGVGLLVARYRPDLYRAARAIAGDSCGRELADSLYADLYGLRESEGREIRYSIIFTAEASWGRGSGLCWRNAMLTRFAGRAARNPIDEASHNEPVERAAGPQRFATQMTLLHPERAKFLAMLQAVLTAVLAKLEPRDRLRLAYYYVDELTLAQIGRLLGEHEATVSRKLERTRRDVAESASRACFEPKRNSARRNCGCAMNTHARSGLSI